MSYDIRLVSFKLCPFVQRSVITLLYKEVDFDIDYIDLSNKPDWFLELSPLGKVPVVQVNQDNAIFESAVINEFVSEVNPPLMLPTDPVEKAQARAWIEFGSNMLGSSFRMQMADNEDDYNEWRDNLRDQMQRLEELLPEDGPYFLGSEFSLVDTSYAPLFMRQAIVDEIHDTAVYDGLPKVQAWAETLLAMPAVQKSVVPEFKDLYVDYLRDHSGYLGAMA